MKKYIRKFVTNSVPSAIVGALIGLWIQEVIYSKFHQVALDELWILVISFLIMMIMLTMIFTKIESSREYQNRVLNDISNGFIMIDNEAISSFAASLVKDSKIVRVIGTARQEAILNNTSDKKSAQKYLKALERRLEHDSEKHPFTYLRVIPKESYKPLVEHVEKCKKMARNTGHRFECIQIEKQNFDFLISYQIFDDEHLLLIVDNKILGQYNDNTLCLWTKNKQIIDVFCERFDSALINSKR